MIPTLKSCKYKKKRYYIAILEFFYNSYDYTVSEELGFIETWNGAEGWSEVSEADLSRVRENAKAAAGMRAQIVKSWKKNTQYAKLLSLLLMYVEDERLLHILFKQLVDQKIPVELIVGEFLPYLHLKVDITPLKPLYQSVWENATTPWMNKWELESYYQDIRKLFGKEYDEEWMKKFVKLMVKKLRVPIEEKEMQS